MMLYLVNLKVAKSYYQGDTKTAEINHIVDAENEQDAEGKIVEHYAKKDEEFYVSHMVIFNYCNQLIY